MLGFGLQKVKKATENRVNVFYRYMGKLIPARTSVGKTLLEAAHENNVPLEGACEGSLACSTCHVIVDSAFYKANEVSDRENDLIDQAYGVAPTSRLSCQVRVTKKMENGVFEIPRCTRNLAVDGYVPPAH